MPSDLETVEHDKTILFYVKKSKNNNNKKQ